MTLHYERVRKALDRQLEACKNPTTQAEWQEAVDAAKLMREIADCVMYGLITTDMDINANQCDEILDQGARLGYLPRERRNRKRLTILGAFTSYSWSELPDRSGW